MPTIQERIFSVVSPAISPAKVYPDVAPDDTRTDHVIYFKVGGVPENTLASGVAISNGRYQFNCWSISRLGANALADLVVSALAGAQFPTNFSATLIDDPEDFDIETKLYRKIVDASLWFY
jgi:hypothetical protein